MAYSINSNCIGCGSCIAVCPAGAVSGEKKSLHAIDAGLCIECGACGRVCPKAAVSDDEGKTIERIKKKNWPIPVIDALKCCACENCVESCPADALTMLDEFAPSAENKAVLRYPERCVSCGWCDENCQFDAIKLEAPNENN